MSENYLEKQKKVFVAFTDIEKAYDRVDSMAIWEVLGMYGVGGKMHGVSTYEYHGLCNNW
jgi:hypothetical protein